MGRIPKIRKCHINFPLIISATTGGSLIDNLKSATNGCRFGILLTVHNKPGNQVEIFRFVPFGRTAIFL